MRKTFFALIFFATSFNYASTWHKIYPDEFSKPFVFRQLIPTLTDLIPLPEYQALALVEIAFCIGLGLLMLYYYENNFKVNIGNDIILIASFCLVIYALNFSYPYKKDYDIPTAFFFLLLFILWSEGKYVLSIPAFALSCLNRETTILIVPVLMFVNTKWVIHIYQVVFFALTKFLMGLVFVDFPGTSMWIRPIENISTHAINANETIGLLAILAICCVLFLRNVQDISAITYVFYFLPVLLVLYVVCGNAFEIRVFAEVLPVLFMGAFLMPD